MGVGGPALTLAALLAEAVAGYPDWLCRAVSHPVGWIGIGISWMDRTLNRPRGSALANRFRGASALLLVLAIVGGVAAGVQSLCLRGLSYAAAILVLGALVSTLLASRSLHAHVNAVGAAVASDGLAGGRAAVSRIVGRNPAALDEAGVLRAAIESLAENFADAVVAPAFWCCLLGLPGVALYKAVNTADSMIGHRTERYATFGWAAARLDDLVNLPASRLAALWIVLAAFGSRDASGLAGARAVWRDARRHRSPNAGWPEAAMAGALGLRLAGPRVYGETRVEDAWMGDGRSAARLADVDRALALYRRACGLQIGAVLALVLALAWVD